MASNKDIFKASVVTVAWEAAVTYGMLDTNPTLMLLSSVIYGVILYMSWRHSETTKRLKKYEEGVSNIAKSLEDSSLK